jgi:biotin transport system substrate-specific component
MEAISKVQLNKIVKTISIIVIGSILLTISAKIKIPFYPVPMTMQTFVVLFLGLAFGYKIGLATVTLYLLEGIFGLPVFANSPEKGIGLVYFTGPTMGYLIGFLVAVYFTRFSFRKDFNWSNYYSQKKEETLLLTSLNALAVFLALFTKLVFAVSFIYILGLLWLGYLIGWDKPIFELGAQPFLLAELFKLLLLTALYPQIKKLNKII